MNALVNFLDQHRGTAHEVARFLGRRASMTGTGQLPKLRKTCSSCANGNTAEVPLLTCTRAKCWTSRLPRAYCGHALLPLQAGSASRTHARAYPHAPIHQGRQFLPYPTTATPAARRAASQRELLVLPRYRSTGRHGLQLCQNLRCGSVAAAKDIPRISSCSSCTDFQARRADIRFKPKGRQDHVLRTLTVPACPQVAP